MAKEIETCEGTPIIEASDRETLKSKVQSEEFLKFCESVIDFKYYTNVDMKTSVSAHNNKFAWKLFMEDTSKYGSYDKAIESLLTEEEPEEPKPSKRVWTAEEIKNLVQTNDKVLYGALKNLYNCQTSDEQSWGETTHANGVGFNAFDAEFLTSVAQFLIRNGFLTDKQKVLTRKKLVKYNAQLTRLANA